jgi:hypothetical protein
VPSASDPQAPSAPEPFRTVVQAWQVPAQAVSQQTPSTQLPVAQTRQPGSLQSLVELQVEACAFWMRHAPLGEQ